MLKKKLKISENTISYSPKQVWGKLLTRLRESGNLALFVSCGELSNFEIKENKFIIKTDKEYLFDIISSKDNLLTIKRSLKFLGIDLEIEVQKSEPANADIDRDINFLKSKFKNLLIE